jgi:hypothetical protein
MVAIVIHIGRGFGFCAATFAVLAAVSGYFVVLYGPYPVD